MARRRGGGGGSSAPVRIPEEQLQRARQAHDFQSQSYSPMDLAHDVSDFSTGTVNDIASIPEGLIGMLSALATNTPLDVAKEAVPAALEQYSHPVDYANEHPGFFMMDLLGGLAGADAALGRAAGMRGASIPEWLGSDEGAIGNLGRRLEEEASTGQFTGVNHDMSGILKMEDEARGISSPELHLTQYPDDVSGLSVIKDHDIQGRGQIAYDTLWNRVGLGETRPKAGAALDPETGNLVSEFVHGSRNARGGEFGIQPEYAQDLQDITIMDYIAGNQDRSMTHNMGSYEGRPFPWDEGFSFRRTKEDQRLGDWMGLEPPANQWPGYELNDRHRQLLDTAYAELNQTLDPEHHIGTYDPLYENTGEAELQAAMARIESAQNRDTLFNMNGPPKNPINAFDDIEQPAQVLDPVAAQGLIDTIMQPGSAGMSDISSSEIFNAPNQVDNFGENLITGGFAGLQAKEPVNLDELLALINQQFPPKPSTPTPDIMGRLQEAIARARQTMGQI